MQLLAGDPADRPPVAETAELLAGCVRAAGGTGAGGGTAILSPATGAGGGTQVLAPRPQAGAQDGAAGGGTAKYGGTGGGTAKYGVAPAGPPAVPPGGSTGPGTLPGTPPAGGATSPEAPPDAPVEPPPRASRWTGALVILVVLALGAGALALVYSRQRAEARRALDAQLSLDGAPLPPARCRAAGAAILGTLRDAVRGLDSAAAGRSGSAGQALSSLERLVGAEGADEPEAWMILARARLEAGSDAKGAVTAARKAASLCPGYAAAEELRGRAAQRAGEPGEARASFARAVEADAAWPAPRRGLGLLLLQQRDYAEAAAALGEALERRPQDLGARLGRAQARLLTADLEGAKADAGEAVRAAPDRPEGWLVLGHVLARSGQLEQALDAFCKARDLGGRDAERYCTRE
ncbi:MAG: tetratricopeptide repeat protein [Anaeromyxobacter sp.]